MSTEETYKIIINKLKDNNASKIAIFGSYARNEQTSSSDIDILVDFKDKKTLLDLIGIEQELEELLSKKVDLLTPGAIHPRRKKYIEKDLLVIYS